jgi:hypothetical protein
MSGTCPVLGRREPETGVSVFSLPPTHRDSAGLFSQAEGSTFDGARRRQTYQIRMACKRSGVRVSVALLRDISAVQRHIRGLDAGLGPLLQHWTGPDPGCVQIGVSAVQGLFRVLGLALARWQEVRSRVGVSRRSAAWFLTGYQAGYRQACVARGAGLVVSAPGRRS